MPSDSIHFQTSFGIRRLLQRSGASVEKREIVYVVDEATDRTRRLLHSRAAVPVTLDPLESLQVKLSFEIVSERGSGTQTPTCIPHSLESTRAPLHSERR